MWCSTRTTPGVSLLNVPSKYLYMTNWRNKNVDIITCDRVIETSQQNQIQNEFQYPKEKLLRRKCY